MIIHHDQVGSYSTRSGWSNTENGEDMAFNIVNSIVGMVAPAIIDKLAAMLGLNSATAKTALMAAVPGVLAAFGNKASTETGARELFDAVSKTDTSQLSNLAKTLGGAGADKLIQGGLGSLGSLLGDNALSGLTGAIAKQAGVSDSASSSIVSMAGQLAMGQLAKSVSGDGLNASSLAGLLSSQQENIASAMPAGLGGLLSGAGLLGSDLASQVSRIDAARAAMSGAVGDAARQAGNVASDAARKASGAASDAARKAGNVANDAARTVNAATHQAAKKGTNWLMWLIPLLILAAALWYFLGNRSHVATDATTAPAATSLTIDGVDIGAQVTSVFDGLKTTLGGITDAASAQAALPKLQEAVKTVDGMSGVIGKLSAAQKTAFGALITAALPVLKELVGKVVAIPGVGDVVKPTLDDLVGKIEAMAKA